MQGFPITLVLAGSVLALGSAAQAALVHQYRAADYTAGVTATWDDHAGTNDLTNAGSPATFPTLVPGATPNGSAAVQFDRTNGFAGDGGRFLSFTTALGAAFTSTPDFALFAVLQDNTPDDSFGMVVSGNDNADLQLRMNGNNFGGVANVSARNIADVGNSATPTLSSFYVLGFTYNAATGAWAFYKDGAPDGAGVTAGLAFNSPELVGTTAGINFSFVGRIAELRFYDSAAANVAAITTDLTNTYLIPEPATVVLGLAGSLLLLARRRH